jgi:NAD(P)-dependent dehydrogenase (short-subunit alcohol dehydrogenase family)
MLEMATHTGAAHLYEQFGLAGRTIAITGAGRGIGRAIAIEAARAGARVAACSRTESDLASLRREIEYLGGQCDSHVVDVSDTDALSTFTEAVVDQSGALDGFVNNAGWNLLKAAVDYTRGEVDRILDLNLRAYYWGCVSAARTMKGLGRGGSIVNVTSRAGLVGNPGRAPYSAAKAGVNNLTRTLAGELATDGIRVNAVAPGLTATPLATEFLDGHPDEGYRMVEQISLGRFAECDEIARPVVFLLAPAASMITGHTLVVDGGWSAV